MIYFLLYITPTWKKIKVSHTEPACLFGTDMTNISYCTVTRLVCDVLHWGEHMGLMNCVVQDICLLLLGLEQFLFFPGGYVQAVTPHCEWWHSKGQCVMLLCSYVYMLLYVYVSVSVYVLIDEQDLSLAFSAKWRQIAYLVSFGLSPVLFKMFFLNMKKIMHCRFKIGLCSNFNDFF